MMVDGMRRCDSEWVLRNSLGSLYEITRSVGGCENPPACLDGRMRNPAPAARVPIPAFPPQPGAKFPPRTKNTCKKYFCRIRTYVIPGEIRKSVREEFDSEC